MDTDNIGYTRRRKTKQKQNTIYGIVNYYTITALEVVIVLLHNILENFRNFMKFLKFLKILTFFLYYCMGVTKWEGDSNFIHWFCTRVQYNRAVCNKTITTLELDQYEVSWSRVQQYWTRHSPRSILLYSAPLNLILISFKCSNCIILISKKQFLLNKKSYCTLVNWKKPNYLYYIYIKADKAQFSFKYS
jgi:hypothetical protein